MHETTKELRSKIKELICETLMTEKADNCYEVIGMLEDIKIGLVSALHETSKEMAKRDFEKDKDKFESYMDNKKKQIEELIKKATSRNDSNDGTTTTAA